jgi:hypothetical protein
MICCICSELIDKYGHDVIIVTLTPNKKFTSPYVQELYAHYSCFKRVIDRSIPVMNPNEN